MFKNLNPWALGIAGHQSEIIELALTHGFTSMDLDVASFASRVRLRGMAFARRLIDSARIRIGSFALPFSIEADEEEFQRAVAKLPEYAQVAADVGCTRCVTLLAPASDKRPYHENFEFHRKRLGEICAALQPAGVNLGIGFQAAEYLRKGQPFQFIHDLEALTLLISMVAAPNLGMLIDTWELTAAGGAVDTISKLSAGQVVAVRVANMPADVPLPDLGDTCRLLPDAENGRIDVVAMLSALAALGYAGPVTPWPSRSVFSTKRREAIVRQSAESLDKVWRAAGLPVERRFATFARL